MGFKGRLAIGQAGESAIAKWLISRGNCVLPVYEKIIDEGKGPQLFTCDGCLIAPDLLAIKGHHIYWIEAKHKEAFTWYRIGRVFETGIDLRHYADYLEIASTTNIPIWLLFLHCGGKAKDSPPSPSGLYGNDLLILSKNVSHQSDRYGSGGMIYWARECDGGPLKHISTYESVARLC